MVELENKISGVAKDSPGRVERLRVNRARPSSISEGDPPKVDLDTLSSKLKKAFSSVDPAKQRSVRDMIRNFESKSNPPPK